METMSTWRYIFVYALIYALTYFCTCVKERKASLKFLHFISEVINIDVRQIYHFGVKGTEWVGLQLSVIVTQTVGRFDMWLLIEFSEDESYDSFVRNLQT